MQAFLRDPRCCARTRLAARVALLGMSSDSYHQRAALRDAQRASERGSDLGEVALNLKIHLKEDASLLSRHVSWHSGRIQYAAGHELKQEAMWQGMALASLGSRDRCLRRCPSSLTRHVAKVSGALSFLLLNVE